MTQPLSNVHAGTSSLPPAPATPAAGMTATTPAAASATVGAGIDQMAVSTGVSTLAANGGLDLVAPSADDIDAAFHGLANIGLPLVSPIAAAGARAGDMLAAGQQLFNSLAGRMQQSWQEFTAQIHPVDLQGGNMALNRRLQLGEAAATSHVTARLQPNSAFQHAYAALSPADKAHYDHVWNALRGNDPASVVARDALQRMLLTPSGPGSLLHPPGGANASGQTLLGSLDALASVPPVNGAPNAPMLLRAVVREVQDPSWINQGNFNSCGAGSAQTLMAAEDPAEYARLARGLATGDGSVTTRGGMTLQRAADWNAADASGRRSITGALMEPAFMHGMEYLRTHVGVGPGYSNTNNHDGQSIFGVALPGASPDDQANLLSNLRGRPYDTTLGTDPQRPWRAAGPGHALTVALNFTDDGPGVSFHYVSVVGYQAASGNQPARVKLYDTATGKERSITEAELESHLIATNAPRGQHAG